MSEEKISIRDPGGYKEKIRRVAGNSISEWVIDAVEQKFNNQQNIVDTLDGMGVHLDVIEITDYILSRMKNIQPLETSKKEFQFEYLNDFISFNLIFKWNIIKQSKRWDLDVIFVGSKSKIEDNRKLGYCEINFNQRKLVDWVFRNVENFEIFQDKLFEIQKCKQ